MPGLSAPLFAFEGHIALPEHDAYLRSALPVGQYILTGPVAKPADGNLPVRGDLAHIKLAGHCFVPHYAVPMPHHVGAQDAVLRRSPRDDGEVLATLEAGAVFDVLDMSGGWAWGQIAEDGAVGYTELANLTQVAP